MAVCALDTVKSEDSSGGMIGACFSLWSLGLMARLPEFASPRSNYYLIKNELKLENNKGCSDLDDVYRRSYLCYFFLYL